MAHQKHLSKNQFEILADNFPLVIFSPILLIHRSHKMNPEIFFIEKFKLELIGKYNDF